MFKEKITKLLKKDLGVDKNLGSYLEIPPNPIFGDYAINCIKIKKDPKDLAKKIKSNIIEKTEIKGPYLNFFINKELLTKKTIKDILKQKSKYGSQNIGKNQKIMIEFSSPNANKPLHIGHLRNNIIGITLSNLLGFTNHKVIKANLINDRGIHISQTMLAYKKWYDKKSPHMKSDHFVGELYVLFNKKLKENQKLEDKAQELLKKWEQKDKETIQLWKKITSWCIEGIKETYKDTNIKFDVWFYESNFYDKALPIIKYGLQKKVFKKEPDNSITINLEEYNLGKKTILRSDGTSIYFTNDLALTKHKFEKYNLNKSLWVVASEQNMYFKQLFKTFELLNYKWSKKCYHLSYGLVHLPEGKMKSREGKVIDADNLLEETIKLAKKEIQKRRIKNKIEKRAKSIALSAINYSLIKPDIQKDILFNPEKAISFEGDTGPYIQYAYARCNSILKKVKKIENKIVKPEEPEAIELVKYLSIFPEIIKDSTAKLKPNLLANYIYELSQKFSNFYEKCPCINEPNKNLKNTKLLIVKATKQVIENSLKLLNIDVLEEM